MIPYVIISIIILIISVYLFIVYRASRKVVATGIIFSGNGKVESKIIYNKDDKKSLYAMALCYAAKIKWVILSEQKWVDKTFTNIFTETLKNWPQIPYVEMLSSLEKEPAVFRIKLYYIRNWSVNNSLPVKLYAGDLATNYFFLLREIVKELNDDEKKILGSLLQETKNDILELQDESYSALIKLTKKINELLVKI